MNDKELLELAAKAAGYVVSSDGEGGLTIPVRRGVCRGWDPLTDDGDALRLAVKLGLQVHSSGVSPCVFVADGFLPPRVDVKERHGKDPFTATRRAIVRAAAAIGGKLP